MGYHQRPIKRGVFGEVSKIVEEADEALEAEEQQNPVMLLVELSDIIGAIKAVLYEKFGEHVTLQDLVKMSDATARAFQMGERQCRQPSTTT